MNNKTSIKAAELLENIRKKVPLIWNFSNFVSMDIAANALLAIGASPAMAHAKEEANDFSQICKVLLTLKTFFGGKSCILTALNMFNIILTDLLI